MGIAITAAKQNMGFGKEAIGALLNYAFTHLDLNRIYLKAYPDNPRAIHVYRQCGFREYYRNDEDVYMDFRNSETGEHTMAKKYMIIDCDTGIDDALAITYILSNPDIELLGVTTTYGNVSVDQSVKNSLLLLEMFKRGDVGVYRGAEHSWITPEYMHSPPLDDLHGRNGIGNVDLGEPAGLVQKENAVDFILDCARKYSSDLHLVFVGPLTNLANCIKKDEEAIKLAGSITIMGGALTVQGNRSIYAEANIADDPQAAAFVLGSSVHVDIVPLDSTLRTLFRVSDIARWEHMNQAGKNLYDIAYFYYVNEYGDENIGGAMHDPLAAYASYDPSIITNWFNCNLTVEENGRMIGTFKELNGAEKRHRIALDVDASRFTADYIALVTELIRKQ
ncbi:MAG: GNAT family N-acetyltransferase [Erysipelotrichaceae bacterium]|nr:GNAT family N-acetyltransferase [Erysipelotrichaceae bacterium]